MKLFLMLVKNRKILSTATIITTIAPAAIQLWWNGQLSVIINTISTGHPPQSTTLIWAITTMFVMSGANYISVFITGYTCESMTHDLRMGYARYFACLPFFETEKLNAGEQLSKLQNEISDVSGYLSDQFFQLFGEAIRFVMTFSWLLFISPTLTLAVNLPSFLIMGYVIWSSKIISRATEQSQQAKGQMNQHADTLLTLFPIIRLYDGLRMTLSGYTKAVTTWEAHTVTAERTRARLMSLSAVLSNVPLLLILLIGGGMAIEGALTIGTLYIFINLSNNVTGAVLMNMPGRIAAFRQFSANMKRLEPMVKKRECVKDFGNIP